MTTDRADLVHGPRRPSPSCHALPYQRTEPGRGNFELYGWLFMRGSGVLLLVLVFGHLFVNLMLGEGIKAIDFAFVAGKWASPFWQVWDLLMLWLAELHGTNGVRTIINDYAERDSHPALLKTLLLSAPSSSSSCSARSSSSPSTRALDPASTLLAVCTAQ